MSYGRKRKDFSGMPSEECDRLAFERIMRSVSVCEQSSQKMRSKMESEGYPQGSIDRSLEKAVRLGAIDDSRYCECLIRQTLSSRKGLRFALKEVESLGIDPSQLESYQEYLEEGEDSQLESALDFLRSRPPRAKDLRGACYRKLMTRGYPSSIASRASRQFAEERALGGEDFIGS